MVTKSELTNTHHQDQLQLEVAQHLLLDHGLDKGVPTAFMAVDSLVPSRFFLVASQLQNWPIPLSTPPPLFIIQCSQNNQGLFMLMLDFCKLHDKIVVL